ncbi:tyrosine-type recombinase/integrase [Peribacillus asahii]|uniref:site-specific integrase n=1 Tax=Peribacillus asahii TaxID=228899 RepID=UPI00380DADB1
MATFRKRGDKWEYRISYKDPFTLKYKVKSKSGFKTKKEAQSAASEEEIKLSNNSELEDKNLRLEDFLNDWLHEYKKDSVRKNTFELHERNINNHILPYFKKSALKDVNPIMYQKFLNNLTQQGYSKRTVQIIHATMNNAFKRAILTGKIQKNPCIGAEIKGQEKDREIKFIESNRIADFLQTAYEYGYIYWIFYKVLIETGMRKGEAAALQWTDIDLKEQTISINKSLDFKEASKDTSKMFGHVKTYTSKRVITISQALANDLRFHQKYQNQNKLTLIDNYHYDLNLVLCRNDGNYMPKSSLFSSFARILKKVGLPSLPIHSTRHTHAVLQLESGASMKYLQERLGHGSMQITADIYSHISKKLDKDTMEKYEECMKNVLK